MPDLGGSPVETESASLPDAIRTILAFHELGAPEPPHCSLVNEYTTGSANETDIAPVKAREHTRWMRARAAQLRLHARRMEHKRCRRDHLMTPENTYQGRKGNQCRLCRNESRARPRKIAR